MQMFQKVFLRRGLKLNKLLLGAYLLSQIMCILGILHLAEKKGAYLLASIGK